MSQKSKFEELISKHEGDLRRIRSKYFPLITDGIITGYNLYSELFDYSHGRLFLNYLHSDLKPTDRHFRELSEKLVNKGFLEKRVIVDIEVIDKERIMAREADYLTKADWKDPLNMRYFDFYGNEISAKEARSLEEELIGEVLQYDWLIKLNNEKELRQVIDIFKTYASKFKLDKQGRKIIEDGKPKYNDSAIPEAWDIPLLVCTSTNDRKPKTLDDFLKVNQFNIGEKLGNTSIILSTLINDKTKEFQKFLIKKGLRIQPVKKYVLRVFVEDYINV